MLSSPLFLPQLNPLRGYRPREIPGLVGAAPTLPANGAPIFDFYRSRSMNAAQMNDLVSRAIRAARANTPASRLYQPGPYDIFSFPAGFESQ